MNSIQFYNRPDEHFSFIHLPHTIYGNYHPIYFAMQLGLTIVLNIILLFKKKSIFISLSAITSFIFLIILGKRSAIVFTLLSIVMITFKRSNYKKAIITALLLSFLLLVLFIISPYNLWRINNIDQMGEGYERLIMLEASLDVLSNNPLFGVGTNNVYDILGEEYLKMNIEPPFYSNNPHSQVLYTLLMSGLIGLAFYISASSVLLYKIIRSKDHVMLISFLFLTAVSFTETILIRQAGIVLYSLSLSIIYFRHAIKKQDNH